LERSIAHGNWAPSGERAQRWRSLLRKRGALGLGGFVLGLLSGLGIYTWQATRPAAALVAAPFDSPPALPVRPPRRIIPAVEGVAPPAAAPPSWPRAALQDRDTDLAAERALLETARTALSRSNSRAALDALDRHLKAFPRGRLSEERESLWIQVLIQLESYDEARARAARFRQRFPRSVFLPAIEQTLRQAP